MTIFFLLSSSLSWGDTFKDEASLLATTLKKSLMSQVKEKINSKGAVQAVEFCHANVKMIAKSAAGKYLEKFSFGRSSHRVRNPQNRPEDWMRPYLDQFQKTSSTRPASAVVHVFEDGKKAYLEPLYLGPLCLKCHGSSLSSGVSQKLKKLYPDDTATGFKVGEFRGVVWVKEK